MFDQTQIDLRIYGSNSNGRCIKKFVDNLQKLEDTYIKENKNNFYQIGKSYTVPHTVLKPIWVDKYNKIIYPEFDNYDDDDCVQLISLEVPIYNLLHNDIESGQFERHYHIDTRWKIDYSFILAKGMIRINEKDIKKIIYKDLVFDTFEEKFITFVDLIKNTPILYTKKLVYVHKGFDLSQIKSINGIITCPMHGRTCSIYSIYSILKNDSTI